jgi:uncharacterized coiled-coil protein SlyX
MKQLHLEDWRKEVETRLTTLENRQDLQGEKLDQQTEKLIELETASMLLAEETTRLTKDYDALKKEFSRTWWFIKTPRGLFSIVLLVMFVYIIYKIA